MTKQPYPIPFIFTAPINLASDSEKNSLIQYFIPLVYELVHQVVNEIKTHKFPTENYRFDERRQSGITNNSGFYLLVNLKNYMCYLGETGEFASRKADYGYVLRLSTRNEVSRKISANIRQEILNNKATLTDFVWIPLLMIGASCYSCKNQSATTQIVLKKAQTAEKSAFLREIEGPVLTKLFEEKKIFFYNKQTGSLFTEGNKFGGSKESGKPSKPIQIQEFAFESISCASNALAVDRKTIRNAKGRFVFELTTEQWLQWDPSKKVTSETQSTFRIQHPTFYAEVKKVG